MPTGTTRLPEAFTIRDLRAGDETGVLAVLVLRLVQGLALTALALHYFDVLFF